jgi:hypothetical protein
MITYVSIHSTKKLNNFIGITLSFIFPHPKVFLKLKFDFLNGLESQTI